MATKQMLDYYDDSELKNPNVNVTGRAANGSTKEVRPLSSKRMGIIDAFKMLLIVFIV